MPASPRATPAPSSAAALRLAPGRNQIGLVFVPLVDARTGAVGGLVAHACWDHPRIGRIGPRRLRALAEATGLAAQLDGWTADRVGEALAEWGAVPLAALRLLAVAVDPASAEQPAFGRHVDAAAALAGLAPERARLVAGYADLAGLLLAHGLSSTAGGSVTPATARDLLAEAVADRAPRRAAALGPFARQLHI